MIDPDLIPQVPDTLDALVAHGQTLKAKGKKLADTGLDVHATWQGLAGFYRAPEAATLFAATAPVKTKAADVGADLAVVGGALVTYADTVRPLRAQLASLQEDARALIDGDDWRLSQDNVDEHNRLLSHVNAAVAAWEAAQRTCANTINALFGGVRYVQDNGDAAHNPNEFGYSGDQLDQARGLPWGSAVERDQHWWEDTWDAVASFSTGLGQDGAEGDLIGVANLLHFNGGDNFQRSWKGIYELAHLTNPAHHTHPAHSDSSGAHGHDGSANTEPANRESLPAEHIPEHVPPKPTPLEARHSLPDLTDEDIVARDPQSGLITGIKDGADGIIPVDKYITDLTHERAAEYAQLRSAGVSEEFWRNALGPVNSVGIDLRTGHVFEGLNDYIPDNYRFHPVTESRVQAVINEARAMAFTLTRMAAHTHTSTRRLPELTPKYMSSTDL